jgi:FkbM family methyltransferase
MACYSSDGYLDLYIARESGLHSLVQPRSENKIRVKTCTLDSIIEKLHIDNIRLIKIDVEGAEIEVIKGAIKTIVKHRPTIIVEVWFSNIAEFVKLMFKLNYRIKVLSTGPDLTYIVAFPRY